MLSTRARRIVYHSRFHDAWYTNSAQCGRIGGARQTKGISCIYFIDRVDRDKGVIIIIIANSKPNKILFPKHDQNKTVGKKSSALYHFWRCIGWNDGIEIPICTLAIQHPV